MIKIKIQYNNNVVEYLKVEGHANSGEYGKDLVCAGVSSIVIGALNNLDTDHFKIQLKEGLVELKAISEVTPHDAVVLETLIVQLQTMHETYPQNLKIIK